MSSKPKFEFKYFDTDTRRLALIKGKNYADQLEKLEEAMSHMVNRMQKLGKGYELTEFTATVGVKAGWLILEANGSITMKWTKIK